MDEAKVGRVGFTEFHNFVEAAVQEPRASLFLSQELDGKKELNRGDRSFYRSLIPDIKLSQIWIGGIPSLFLQFPKKILRRLDFSPQELQQKKIISQRSSDFFRFQEKSHHLRLEENKAVVISDGKIDITDRSIGIIDYG